MNNTPVKTIHWAAVENADILKPIDKDRLPQPVLRVEKKQQQREGFQNEKALLYNLQRAGSPTEMKLCIPTFKGFAVLKLEDIILCEAEKNYTVIHVKDKKPIIVSRTLLEYEKILDGTPFLRVHRTFLINLQHVTEYHRGEGGIIIMSNGTEVEISRRKKELFMSKMRGVFRC
jgi:two-component system, LytTR family, response regulator